MPKNKVPEYVREAIRRKARHNVIVDRADKVIREWLDSIGHVEDDSFLDVLIDNTEQATDGSEHCIEEFEQMLSCL